MQHKMKCPHNLLDFHGNLIESGYANTPILKYERDQVKMDHRYLKEWDYYLLANDDFGVAFSIASIGIMSRITTNFMDYRTGEHYTESDIIMVGNDQFGMPSDVFQSLGFKGENANANFVRSDDKITMKVEHRNYFDRTLSLNATLTLPDYDGMAIVVPFDERRDMFYYNYKLTCIRVSGSATFGDKTVSFDDTPTYAIYDYGRGIWPQHNTWYWGSGNGIVDGNDFGFNIGYGFGNPTAATENMLFWNGKCHKLENVTFHIDEEDFMRPWKFTSSDNRFEMDFVPVLDRSSGLAANGYGSAQHQTFGKFTGKAVLDNGTVIEIKDFFGFAEKVVNNFGPTGISNE